ncbi:MAG: hypothetical protein U0903_05390 [Planctomycetales bacterium]
MMPHPDFAIRAVADYKGAFGSKVEYRSLLAFPNLRSLHLERGRVTDEMVETLSRCAALRGLTFSKSELTDVEVKMLTRLKQLTSLEVGVLRISDEGLKAFAEFPRLTYLSIEAVEIQGADFELMGKALQLEGLNLQGKGFGDPQIEGMVMAFRESSLKRLTLSTPAVTDTFLRALSEMTNIQTLNFFEVKVSDEGLKSVAKMGALKQLSLFGTASSGEGVLAFKKSRPEVFVQGDDGLRRRMEAVNKADGN